MIDVNSHCVLQPDAPVIPLLRITPVVLEETVLPNADPSRTSSPAPAPAPAPVTLPPRAASAAAKKGFGALLRASKTGELENIVSTLPAEGSTQQLSGSHTTEDAAKVASLASALSSAEQRYAALQQQQDDRDHEVVQLRELQAVVQGRFSDLESSMTALVRSSQQQQQQQLQQLEQQQQAAPPVVLEQLQQLVGGLSHVLSSVSSTESRVRVELLKQEQSAVIAEQELAQALAEVDMLRRRNSELEQVLTKMSGDSSSSSSMEGYAVRGARFSSREKELEAALMELKGEIADRDKCILCIMEQMNAAAAAHEEAALVSTTLLHQQRTLNADIERDRQRLLQVLQRALVVSVPLCNSLPAQSLQFYEGVIKQTDASNALIRKQLSDAAAENLELQRLIMNQDVRKHEVETKLRIMEVVVCI